MQCLVSPCESAANRAGSTDQFRDFLTSLLNYCYAMTDSLIDTPSYDLAITVEDSIYGLMVKHGYAYSLKELQA
jgi:hypothetical protein